MPLKIAILASGSGTNAQTIMDRIAAGVLDAEIRLILCNRPGARVLDRARDAGLPSLLLDHTAFPDRAAFDAAVRDAVLESGAECVVLAGWMRLLSPVFLDAFPGAVVNLHPAILPSFPGTHGGADALAWGVRISGCTVHFVEEAMDAGPAIIQAAVPVNAGESEDELMARIHAMEHRIYPQALQWLARGRIRVDGRQVRLAPDPAAGRAERGPQDDWLVWPPLERGF